MPAKAYAGFLGTFDAVVSSRLHTGVLALTASTPVVPIEGLQFKITAAMTAAGVPLAAVRPGDPGWVDNVLRSLDSILADPAAARAWAGAAVRRQRESIDEFVDGVIHRLRLG
ncbi:polysaccharide pyruvyl transferase family protein [Sphingomonas piscis]|uniref:Polysaccharide pyruvyl transferase family protein n=1 Tax=Sphingomonas piscis TaxID=2714943 RepID=A0A6G7YR99_9SPHN|nr:polysaccharide pyruvyl transferase family protein [Sphingomonas piscis]QIK79262.1 polysaccharide pyruvyl transferase family protein [Sphingomonas piscis]